jgi:hypothetical protein
MRHPKSGPLPGPDLSHRAEAGGGDYQIGCTETPPSTTRFCPVIHSAIGDARNTQALPTSAGCPNRPSGTAWRYRRMPSGQSRSRPSRQISPGEMLSIRIPDGPYSNGLNRREAPGQVGVHHLAPQLHRHRGELGDRLYSGVNHGRVHPAERVDGRGHQAPEAIGVVMSH